MASVRRALHAWTSSKPTTSCYETRARRTLLGACRSRRALACPFQSPLHDRSDVCRGRRRNSGSVELGMLIRCAAEPGGLHCRPRAFLVRRGPASPSALWGDVRVARGRTSRGPRNRRAYRCRRACFQTVRPRVARRAGTQRGLGSASGHVIARRPSQKRTFLKHRNASGKRPETGAFSVSKAVSKARCPKNRFTT